MRIEAFQPLTNMSNRVLSDVSTDINNTFQTNNNETMESYNSILGNYANAKKSIYDKTQNYYLRKDSSNPYLNKIIRFTNGYTFYVTNQGVAKFHPNGTVYHSTVGKNGCPSQIVSVDIPWSDAYLTAGAIIPTNPSLVVGTHMKENQACGNEGNNILVNKIVNEISSKYVGCFKDDVLHPTMKFIGGAPPISISTSGVLNGNFDKSTRSNNSHTYLISKTEIPNWEFNNAIILNNSNAWGYPMPYPKGSQCVSLQIHDGGSKLSSISQMIKFEPGTYKLSWYSCGRPNYGKRPVEILIDTTSVFNYTPTTNTWELRTCPFTITTSGEHTVTIRAYDDKQPGDRSTAIQGVSIDVGDNPNVNNGNYDEEFCKNSAIDQGYKYYAVQNVNTATKKGYCAVSNDIVAPTRIPQDLVPGNAVLLWKTDATISTGESCTATLNTLGTLNIVDSNQKTLFSTTNNQPAQSSEYIGCYGDKSSRAMEKYFGDGPLSTCNDYAKKNNYKYVGVQFVQERKYGQCFGSNDLKKAQKYGKSTNCSAMIDGNTGGGAWANAIYKVGDVSNGGDLGSNYFLLVEDNGNVSIYKGTDLNDKQALIWQTNTAGKSVEPNERYKASKGKYASNLVASGFILSVGDFIGSPSGSAYLIMQSNGNLGLYTSNSIPACPVINNKNMGTYGINAIYELDKVGDKNKVGQLKYVDQDSNLVSYPDKNIGYADTYTKWQNYDLGGWDFGNRPGTVDEIANTCNTTKGCKSFNQNGWYKSNDTPSNITLYPYANLVQYIRNKKPVESFTGFTKPVANIDSIQYKNYATLGYDINNPKLNTLDVAMTPDDKNSILTGEQQIQEIAKKVKANNDLLASNANKINTRLSKNANVIPLYSNQYDTMVNTQLQEMNQSIHGFDGIVKDSNIVVSHEYYVTIFWVILTLIIMIIFIKVILK